MLTQPEIKLGAEVEMRGRKWLVVRIIQSDALVEDHGDILLVKESYAELRDEGHDVEFMIFYSNEEPTTNLSSIKPLSRITWRGAQPV